MQFGDLEQRHYHHGNVKEALIDEALKYIETEDLERLSLRCLAREVGISPSAVYNHFADKNALMFAIKLRLYRELNSYFARFRQPVADPEQSLLNMCLAYYRFAEDNPTQFQILFTSTLPMERTTPEYIEVSGRCLAETRKAVLKIFNKYHEKSSEESVVRATMLIWSQLHGLISLKRAGTIKAAAANQGWPQSCTLSSEEDVEQLISIFVRNAVTAIINAQRYRGITGASTGDH
jgi:AcrR family transcriptional regulator